MNMSTAAGCIFFFFFCFSILSSSSAQSGENKKAAVPQVLSNLTGKEAVFYKGIVAPMVNYCVPVPVTKTFGKKLCVPVEKLKEIFVGVGLATKHKERLCATVGRLNELFKELDELKATHGNMSGEQNGMSKEIDEIFTRIRAVISADLFYFKEEYGHLESTSEVFKELLNIAKPERRHLNALYKQTFGQLIEELKKRGENGHLKQTNIKGHQSQRNKIAIKLLWIGFSIYSLFHKNVEEEQEWAYQQMVVNLAIYSLNFEKPGKDEKILKIVESWPIGMTNVSLEYLTGKDDKFYRQIVAPLVAKCDQKDFEHNIKKEEEKFCVNLKVMDKLFIEMDGEYQRAAGGRNGHVREVNAENVGKSFVQIHRVITADLSELYKEYGNSMKMEIKESIMKEVQQIAKPKRRHLDAEFKQTFGQLIGKLKQRENDRNKQVQTNDQSQGDTIAFKLLRIGLHMSQLFRKNIEEEAEWAYQQMIANLAVHSLNLDKLGEEVNIVKSVLESWPIGMTNLSLELTGKNEKFYKQIVAPLVAKCDKDDYDQNIKDTEAKFCSNLKVVDKLFIEMDGEYHKENINNILEQIHAVILADLSELHKEYGPLLNMECEEVIIAREKSHLNTEFVQTFGQFIEELKNGEKHVHKGDEPLIVDQNENSAAARVAFRLVCIGQQMAAVFNRKVDEKQEWAYQQMVVNLAIHSLRIYKFSEEGNILESIENWPIGMIECDLIEQRSAATPKDSPASLTNLAGKDKEFYNLIIVPLMPKCFRYRHFTVKEKEILCEDVIRLNKFYMELNERNKLATLGIYKTQEVAIEQKIADIKWNIRHLINYHAMIQLMEVYKRKLANLADPIETEINSIPAPKRVNLKNAFKQTYKEWKTEIDNKNRQGQTDDDKYTINSEGYRIAHADIITFKLLYIGHQMVEEFKKDGVTDYAAKEVALHWAYQQFAVCLRIHSIRLAPNSQNGKFERELEVIAKSWPEIGIKIEKEEKEEKEEDTIEPSIPIAAVPNGIN